MTERTDSKAVDGLYPDPGDGRKQPCGHKKCWVTKQELKGVQSGTPNSKAINVHLEMKSQLSFNQH